VSERGPGRRQALELGALAASVGVAGLASWPLCAALVTPGPRSNDEPPWLDLAADAEVREGAQLLVAARAPRRDGWLVALRDLGAVWLLRRSGALQAFSAACPHLGCSVAARQGGGFHCPCHGSVFSADGAALSGPAPRGLDPLPVRVQAGRVLVQVEQFAPGSAQRKAV
jgi:Rieske Fe-S protein